MLYYYYYHHCLPFVNEVWGLYIVLSSSPPPIPQTNHHPCKEHHRHRTTTSSLVHSRPIAMFAPLDLFLDLCLILRFHIPGRPILAYYQPAKRSSSSLTSSPSTTAAAAAAAAFAINPPAANALRRLPHQLREMPRRFAEAGRAAEIVFEPLVAPGFDGGGGVCIALGEVFAEGTALVTQILEGRGGWEERGRRGRTECFHSHWPAWAAA